MKNNKPKKPKSEVSASGFALFPNMYGDLDWATRSEGNTGQLLGNRNWFEAMQTASGINKKIRQNVVEGDTDYSQYMKVSPSFFHTKNNPEIVASFDKGGPLTEKANMIYNSPFTENYPSPYVGLVPLQGQDDIYLNGDVNARAYNQAMEDRGVSNEERLKYQNEELQKLMQFKNAQQFANGGPMNSFYASLPENYYAAGGPITPPKKASSPYIHTYTPTLPKDYGTTYSSRAKAYSTNPIDPKTGAPTWGSGSEDSGSSGTGGDYIPITAAERAARIKELESFPEGAVTPEYFEEYLTLKNGKGYFRAKGDPNKTMYEPYDLRTYKPATTPVVSSPSSSIPELPEFKDEFQNVKPEEFAFRDATILKQDGTNPEYLNPNEVKERFAKGDSSVAISPYWSSDSNLPGGEKQKGNQGTSFNVPRVDTMTPEGKYMSTNKFNEGGFLNSSVMFEEGGKINNLPNPSPETNNTFSKMNVNDRSAYIVNVLQKEIAKAKAEGRLGENENINVEGLAAQVLLESGNGTSGLATKYNNFGGIKADANWKGQTAEMNGMKWRVYNSVEEGLAEQVNFLINNERYRKAGALNANNTAEDYLKAVQSAGYAGDPNKEGKNYVTSTMEMVKSLPKRLAKADPSLASMALTNTTSQEPVVIDQPISSLNPLGMKDLSQRPLITQNANGLITQQSDPNQIPNVSGMKMDAPKGWFGSGKSLFNEGGPMEQLTQFNNGGTHEQNPLGGIPQGTNSEGQVNLVEEGETKLNSANYIYSDSLKVDSKIASQFNLSKSDIGKTFADVSKKMNRPNSRRENDKIEQEAIKRDLDKLMEAQETFKKQEVERKMAEIQSLDPTAFTQPQPSTPQMPMEQPPMDPMMMQQMGMKYGGNMYDFGGQLGAGLAGVASGVAGSLLPGPLGGIATKGIDALHNSLDKNITEQEKSIAGFGKAAGAIGTAAFTGGASLMNGVDDIAGGLGQGVTNIKGVDGTADTAINAITGLAGMAGGKIFNNGGTVNTGPLTEEEYLKQQQNSVFSANTPSPYIGNTGLTDPNTYNHNAGYAVQPKDTNQFSDFNSQTGVSKSAFEYNQSLPNAIMTGLPAAYNLYQGIFGKTADVPTAEDLYTSIDSPEMNINPQLRQTDQTFAQGQEAVRNAAPGGGSYLSNMQQFANSRNQAYSSLYGQKENIDAQNKMKADMFNAQNKGNATLQAFDLKSRAEAAKQNYLQTGLAQVGQMGQTNAANELAGIYNSMAAPDFSFEYNPWFKVQANKKSNKNV